MDMKKISMICALGLGILAAVSCCKGKNEVTAIVAGPEQNVVALAIEYEAPICPDSICPEAFEVEGKEVAAVKACKEGRVFVFLKPCCKGEKPECEAKAECAEGRPECKAEAGCEAKPGCKSEAKCDKPCEKKCEAGEKDCDKCGKCDKPEGKCCGKPECCGKENCAEAKPECDKCKKGEKECKVAVPKISVKQVVDIKDVEGNVVPAWKKAVKASDVKVARHGKHHGGHACKEGKPECGKAEAGCGEGKPECKAEAGCEAKAGCKSEAKCDKPCEKKCEAGEKDCDKPCGKRCKD